MKLNTFNVVLVGLITIFLLYVQVSDANITLVANGPIITQIPTITASPTPEAGVPKILYIPRINLSAPIEGVGTNFYGTMLVPDNIENVGWYQDGFRPGTHGNAVIAGHLDSVYGPAIFWNVPSLAVGDLIYVTDDRTKTYVFEITEKNTYPFDGVPLDQVFGSSDEIRLNLITCVGWFNHATKNYSQRMILTSVLKSVYTL